jgi:hypothetical protein
LQPSATVPPQPVGPRPAGSAVAGPRVRAALRDLAREQPVALTVRGDCMAPRLRDGQRVEVAPARFYWPGDIVAFETPQGRLAVHRLLGFRLLRGRLAYVTRGDRSVVADRPVPPERLVGRTLTPPPAADRARAVLALLTLALRALRRRLPA